MEKTKFKFFQGQQINHRLFRYRGLIYNIDPLYLGDDEWYNLMTVTNPPKDAPWYHILVHGTDYVTYVAERNIRGHMGDEFIDHPLLSGFFDGYHQGVYHRSNQNTIPIH